MVGSFFAGHSVSSGPQVVLITFNFLGMVGSFFAGQSSAVAAQYLLSGQQNQLASGQHPAGHSVSSGPQVVFTTDNFFGRVGNFFGWAVISSGGTVSIVGTAEPVGFWATSSWAFSFIWATGGLDYIQFSGNGGEFFCWAVISGGGTISVVGTTEPVGFWATSSWAF